MADFFVRLLRDKQLGVVGGVIALALLVLRHFRRCLGSP